MEGMVVIHQPANQAQQQQQRGLMPRRRPSSTDPAREPPATSEGLGSIVIGGKDEPPSGPPEEDENRSPSMGMIGQMRCLPLAILEELLVQREGDQQKELRREHHHLHQADSDGDSSSYGSDVRVHQNPVAQEPRIPASQASRGADSTIVS